MDNIHVIITPEEIALVRRIASEIYTEYCPAREAGEITKEDFYHYGIIGLLEAKRTYDNSRGVPWLVFAAYRIRGAMIDQLRRQPIIRLPQKKQQKVKALKEAKIELARTGSPAEPELLAEKLGWALEEVEKVLTLSSSMIPVAGDWRDGDDEYGYKGKSLTDPGVNPEKATMKKELAEVVNKCLEALPSPEDRLVIEGRVVKGLKLRELAETLGCSLENVRQWQKRVERLMKICMERHGWTPF